MTRNFLQCVLVLENQSTSTTAWTSPTNLQAFQLLMFHFDDRRPKVRRTAYRMFFGGSFIFLIEYMFQRYLCTLFSICCAMQGALSVMQVHKRENPNSKLLCRVSESCNETLKMARKWGSTKCYIHSAF